MRNSVGAGQVVVFCAKLALFAVFAAKTAEYAVFAVKLAVIAGFAEQARHNSGNYRTICRNRWKNAEQADFDEKCRTSDKWLAKTCSQRS